MAEDKKLKAVKDESVDDLIAALRAAQVRLRDLNAKRAQLQSQANAADIQITEQREEIRRIENQIILAARGRDAP